MSFWRREGDQASARSGNAHAREGDSARGCQTSLWPAASAVTYVAPHLRLLILSLGIRRYYGREGSLVVVLLCAGTKRTQARDIVVAQAYWKEYLDAKKTD